MKHRVGSERCVQQKSAEILVLKVVIVALRQEESF